MTSSSDDFNPLTFEKQLTQLKDTQESIQSLSSWCLKNRLHHKKIVASWLNVLKRAKVEHRLTLFYLANDVIQYSKRKSYEFVESWGTTLQKATPLVRDDKVKHRILRIFKIWEERVIYDDEFLTDLTGLLSAAAGKQAPDIDPNDFQAMLLVNKIRQCSVLESDTDQQLKFIHESKLALNDADALGASLKERRDVEEAKQELEEGVGKLEGYVRALQKELVARAALCRLLQKAHNHYTTQRGEVKVVANAYKNFGGRVRGLKRKLDDLCDKLPSPQASPVPSPPSPGETVPSPGPDEDLELPQVLHHDTSEGYNLDKTFSTSLIGEDLGNKGFSSFLGSNDIFTSFQSKNQVSANKIEVISSRPNQPPREDFSIDDFFKSLIPTKPTTVANNVSEVDTYPGLLPPPPLPPAILPGLDLLGESTHLPPPDTLNFYGTNTKVSVTPEPVVTSIVPEYLSPVLENKGNNSWNKSWERRLPLLDTPESPPAKDRVDTGHNTTIRSEPVTPRSDVDHRKLMAPPPPPHMPSLLLEADDVDHRRLPPLPPPPLLVTPSDRNRQTAHNDVDHRNLISLTGSLPPPPAPPVSPWTPHAVHHLDQDYRVMADVPPPPPPRMRTPATDIVEIMDMEMSDEEHDDEYSRLARVENTMSRLHGIPPPAIRQNQPPPQFRKQEHAGNREQREHMNRDQHANREHSNRDKPFINNNKLLVGGLEMHGNTNNVHKNESSKDAATRGNLVRINSMIDEGMGTLDMRTLSPGYQKNDSQTSTPPNDIFSDLVNNSMNPVNPNLHLTPLEHSEVRRHHLVPDFEHHLKPERGGNGDLKDTEMSDNEWERSEEELSHQEPASWQQQPPAMNPMRPNFRPGFRGPVSLGPRFRPHMFSRPPPQRNEFFERDFHQRGAPNFRRPWGGPRPQRGYW